MPAVDDGTAGERLLWRLRDEYALVVDVDRLRPADVARIADGDAVHVPVDDHAATCRSRISASHAGGPLPEVPTRGRRAETPVLRPIEPNERTIIEPL